MGTVKRKSLKSKLDALGDIDLDDFLDTVVADPLNALDDAMDEAVELLDGLFSGEESHDKYGGSGGYTYPAPPPPPAPPAVRRVGGARSRHDAAMAKHDVRMKKHNAKMATHMDKHNARMKNFDAKMKKLRGQSSSDFDVHSTHGIASGTKHKHTIKLRDINTDTTIVVTFNDENSYAVTSNTGSVPNSDEVKRHIRNHLKKTPTPTPPKMPENETVYEHELSHRANLSLAREQNPIFWSRTWTGGKKESIEINKDSKVTISGHNMFGRKYEVTVDGTAIHVPNVEGYMFHNYRYNNLDAFVEMCTDEEKEILRKIIDGLIALKIAETHHTELKELL